MSNNSRKLVQLPLEAYRYKFAVKHEYYQGTHFHVPFHLPMVMSLNYRDMQAHFDRVNQSETKCILLVNMYKPTPAKLYTLSNWLDKIFVSRLHYTLEAAAAYGRQAKDTILQFRDLFDIQEHEYSYDRAHRAWQRKYKALKEANPELMNFDFNELRMAPKRKRGGQLQGPHLSDL